TYGGLFFIMILQALTGMMMFAPQSNAFWAPFFMDMLVYFDGFFPIRLIHHWLMWAFILFAIVHIYLVFYHDYIEKNGIASSIIGGWKFIPLPIVQDYASERTMAKDVKLLKKQLRKEQRAKRKPEDPARQE
ncbi:MAG: cytochrome b/b6 domain-containing protein, partial [Bacteroidales bacterium]